MSIAERKIIRALKLGRVPFEGAHLMATGRAAEIAEFGRILDDVAMGLSDVRLLRGDYGSGKTFMCSVMREMAFARNFAVSVVNLNRDVPFGRRERVLDQLIAGLRTRDMPADPAFGTILETWSSRFDLTMPVDANEQLDLALRSYAALDGAFVNGLRSWLRAYVEGETELMGAAIAWMRGDAILQEHRTKLKLVGRLTPETAFRRLKSILRLIVDAGFPGVVVLLDEAESIMRLQAQQRLAAYTSIRELIDTCESDFPHCLFLFAGTQPLFEDPNRGIASYEALYQRIRNQSTSSVRDLRQPIIRLEELDEDSLNAVARRVRDLHGIAYRWDSASAFSDAGIETFVRDVATRFGEIRQKPRAFLKGFVDVLDAKQQGLEVNSESVVRTALESVESADSQLEEVVLAGS